MHAHRVVAAALASGCWTSAPPPPTVAAAPAGPRACKVVGNGPNATAHVSAVAGDAPFLDGFWVEKTIVEIARGAGASSWLPIDVRQQRMAVRGFVRAPELALYSRAPRILAGVLVVGSGQRLELARGDGEGVDVTLALPAAVRLVDPARARLRLTCSELSAFVSTGQSVEDTLGIRAGDERHVFATPSVAVAAVPGGPAVATLDTHELIADTIEQRGASTRVWIMLSEADALSVVGWVPTASLGDPPGVGDGGGTGWGWGRSGTPGRLPALRHCPGEVAISLVRAGAPGRVVVGELAAGTDVAVDTAIEAPPGTVALGRYAIGSLRLVDGASLVIDDAACDQNRSPSSGP